MNIIPRGIILLVHILIAIALLLSLITYFPNDPGWTYIGDYQDKIHNYLGLAGAWIANVLLSLFGYMSYAIPLISICLSIYKIKHRRVDVLQSLFASVLIMVSGSTIASLHIANTIPIPISSGGLLGSITAHILLPYLSLEIISAIAIFAFIAGVFLIFLVDILKLCDFIGNLVYNPIEYVYYKLKPIHNTKKEPASTKNIVDVEEEEEKKDVTKKPQKQSIKKNPFHKPYTNFILGIFSKKPSAYSRRIEPYIDESMLPNKYDNKNDSSHKNIHIPEYLENYRTAYQDAFGKLPDDISQHFEGQDVLSVSPEDSDEYSYTNYTKDSIDTKPNNQSDNQASDVNSKAYQSYTLVNENNVDNQSSESTEIPLVNNQEINTNIAEQSSVAEHQQPIVVEKDTNAETYITETSSVNNLVENNVDNQSSESTEIPLVNNQEINTNIAEQSSIAEQQQPIAVEKDTNEETYITETSSVNNLVENNLDNQHIESTEIPLVNNQEINTNIAEQSSMAEQQEPIVVEKDANAETYITETSSVNNLVENNLDNQSLESVEIPLVNNQEINTNIAEQSSMAEHQEPIVVEKDANAETYITETSSVNNLAENNVDNHPITENTSSNIYNHLPSKSGDSEIVYQPSLNEEPVSDDEIDYFAQQQDDETSETTQNSNTAESVVKTTEAPKPKKNITYHLPGDGLLSTTSVDEQVNINREILDQKGILLERMLNEYNVKAKVVAINPGPVITRFEIQPAAGVKVIRIANLAKDLARSLTVTSVRVVEVIPGKSTVGIEIPNEKRQMVRLGDVIYSGDFKASTDLALALGHDIEGEPIIANLAKMPHLLVAGTTGSGKSVGVNSMLISLLFKLDPQQVRMILIDPKMLELSVYNGIPHLMTPVITDMKDAANGLRWSVAEMEKRYKLMSELGVRNLEGYNNKIKASNETIADPTYTGNQEDAPMLKPLPFIVIVIDEFADMMMIVGKKVEELIARIAQKARAAGIHLILATQRPSVDVITGLIKANIPTRMAFQVSSKIDSRTIIDQSGADQLLGHGDMLYQPPGTSVPLRVHGAFVSDDEVHKVVSFWKEQDGPEYIDSITKSEEESNQESEPNQDNDTDELYSTAVDFVTETQRVSISYVQRKLRIGYNRAARIIEMMEEKGVVSQMESNGKREVLISNQPNS